MIQIKLVSNKTKVSIYLQLVVFIHQTLFMSNQAVINNSLIVILMIQMLSLKNLTAKTQG